MHFNLGCLLLILIHIIFSYFPHTMSVWNSLDSECVTSSTYTSFMEVRLFLAFTTQSIIEKKIYIYLPHVFLFLTAPAIITSPAAPQTVTVDEGDSVTLACDASGSPAPNFSWLNSTSGLVLDSFTAATITNTSELGANFFYTMSNLTISPAREEDAGMYRCVAQTTVGRQAQQNYTLIVNCKT